MRASGAFRFPFTQSLSVTGSTSPASGAGAAAATLFAGWVLTEAVPSSSILAFVQRLPVKKAPPIRRITRKAVNFGLLSNLSIKVNIKDL